MEGLNGDFLGFTFNTGEGHFKSQDLGITRVSDGDRYKDSLIPEIEDKTVEIPGLDGAYFYGSNFKPRNFSLSITFDGVTEAQLKQMRQVFGYKHTGQLIFDEMPYKKYLVKVASPPEFNYVCFDERPKTAGETIPEGGIRWKTVERTVPVTDDADDVPVSTDDNTPVTATETVRVREDITPWADTSEQRIYKGDGSIEFVAYYPFAKQVAKTRNAFEKLGYDNIDEWWETSGLLDSYEGIDIYDGSAISVYNPGDMETGFRLYIPFTNNVIPAFTLTYKDHVLNISEITKKEEDVIVGEETVPGSAGVQINTVNGLIEGVWKKVNVLDINDSLVTSGQIYNEYATGEFFKIEPNIQAQQINTSTNLGNGVEIYYDYLYF